MRFRGRYLALALPLALGLLAGCGEEQDPISYVQPNVLEKTFFVGQDLLDPVDDPEFWAQQSIIDVGYGASQGGLFTSTWAQPMSRIKWVIQEDHLIARLSYERIEDADGKGAGKLTNDGIVVAMFRIQKHFDIQRRYNPATGEPSNVIEENTSDRPWYERDYMRVDWSKNLATDTYEFDTLAQVGIYGGVDYEPVAYYVNDPTSEDAPFFDEKTGYFDVTTKAFAVPGVVDLRKYGWGIDFFPACMLDPDFSGGTAPAGNCNPIELTLRHAFRPVVDNDYEPQNWDGHRFKAFGAFTVERYGFARNYGMPDDLHRYFISRYNLWQRSHYYDDPEKMDGPIECFKPVSFGGLTNPGDDPNRDANGNGTADECEEVTERLGVGGSQCDIFTQKCTLPYRAREVRPVTWYYSTGSDPRYFEGTDWAAHEWDIALRGAVQAAKYAECMMIGDEPEVQSAVATPAEVCKQKYPMWDGQIEDATDAIALAREVDDCRHQVAYLDRKGQNCESIADTVADARGITDQSVIHAAKMGEVVVLCHSPVEANDPEVCGHPRLRPGLTAAACFDARVEGDRELLAECNEALNARRGDLRFHVVNAIPTPQTPSPWGIMADAADPLTGEKVSASINVWTYINDLWSQQLVDTARYISGELSTDQVTEGTYIKDWSKAAEAASRNGALAPMTREELDKKFAAAVGVDAEEFKALRERFGSMDANLKAELRQVAKKAQKFKTGLGGVSHSRVAYEARRQRAVGSQTEAGLVTPMMQQLAGVDGIADTRMATDFSSPLRGTNPVMAREFRQMKENALAQRGACVLSEAPAPLAVADLTGLLEQKFEPFNKNDSKAQQLARAERMRAYIAQKAQYAVIAHEMGHSVGLRHNFVSSSDAWGYRPQYWQLRTNDGKLTRACVDPNTDQPGLQPDGNCVGPRWFDPMTDNERDNLLWMWMNSSIMDYAGEPTQDFLGLGAYDHAATRMFYGETMSVFADTSFKRDTDRGSAMIEKQDTFGGIVGLQWELGGEDLHYSQLQEKFDLIQDCEPVADIEAFKPATWNEERDGKFSPVLDALIVEVDGEYTRCKQQPVDYVTYRSMKSAGIDQFGDVVGKQYDQAGRVRVPYGFATDGWADHGNLSVYRHDNGADAYELFDFFITQQEVGHIFDNYRRNRATFSVRGAYSRALSRYNEKMRDGAKGLALMANVYRDVALANHYDFNSLWSFIASEFFPDNILASTIAFDQFTRIMQRPEAGPHFLPRFGATIGSGTPAEDGVWRSTTDTYADNAPTVDRDIDLIVPNGATGLYGVVNWGGKPMGNALSNNQGEYNSSYTINAGAYYEKAFTAILMTESVDNFISDSRNDFVDPRYRSVSLADLFPDGYRRWFANNLTGDDALKGARVEATVRGSNLEPVVDGERYPAQGIGWTSWTPVTGPETCFVGTGSLEPFPDETGRLKCTPAPANSIVLDPQVGWEQQKFLIAWTLQYLPENQQQKWLNMMYLWELGADSDPGFANRIELHDPYGRIYVAKTFGKETIFGKRVQKGISARVLEYANELVQKAFVTEPGPDLDGDSVPEWYVPQFRADGEPRVKYDPTVRSIGADGRFGASPVCNEQTDEGCTCEHNMACVALQRYMEVPFFLRQAMADYGLADPSMRGVY